MVYLVLSAVVGLMLAVCGGFTLTAAHRIRRLPRAAPVEEFRVTLYEWAALGDRKRVVLTALTRVYLGPSPDAGRQPVADDAPRDAVEDAAMAAWRKHAPHDPARAVRVAAKSAAVGQATARIAALKMVTEEQLGRALTSALESLQIPLMGAASLLFASLIGWAKGASGALVAVVVSGGLLLIGLAVYGAVRAVPRSVTGHDGVVVGYLAGRGGRFRLVVDPEPPEHAAALLSVAGFGTGSVSMPQALRDTILYPPTIELNGSGGVGLGI
ncbi:hypothetical protein ACFYP4_15560 [Streptomyces sp. NPDC005551]|uniref:hypothetical protein n=1 Tax=unclassified Streptomyces TaxID=2593676 RepID=UPI0033F5E93C